jgi:hypothetical protein
VRLSTGSPWIVSGTTDQGPYVILGSPLDPESSTLPISAAMVPLLEWMTSLGSAAAAGRIEAGQPILVPASATHVRTPDGTTHAVDGAAEFRETRDAGIYSILRGDEVLENVAVGPPVRESLLSPLPVDAFEDRIGPGVQTADDARAWNREIFVTRQGPELWKPLLVVALLLLLVEAWVAAPGASAGSRVGKRAPEEARREVGVPAT